MTRMYIPIPIRLALRNLIIMMRERQIDAPTVNIHHPAQHLTAHDRALDVPPRPPRPPRTLPARLPLLTRFPQGEILRVFLLLWQPAATHCRRQRARPAARQRTLAVSNQRFIPATPRLQLRVVVPSTLVGCDIKVDAAVGGGIGKALGHELLNEGYVLGNELGDAGDGRWGEDVERAHVLVEVAFPVCGELGEDVLGVGTVFVQTVEVGEENRGGGGVEGLSFFGGAGEGSGCGEEGVEVHLELRGRLVQGDFLFGLGVRVGFAGFLFGNDGCEVCVGSVSPCGELFGGDSIPVGVASDLGVEVGYPGRRHTVQDRGSNRGALGDEFVEEVLLAGTEDNLLVPKLPLAAVQSSHETQPTLSSTSVTFCTNFTSKPK